MLIKILRGLLGARGQGAKAARLQRPSDVAVCVQTVLRPCVERAVESVFEQDFRGTIHLVVGVDAALGSRDVLRRLERKAPRNVSMTVVDPGYSTSVRHGGLYSNHFGGATRTICSYLANSQYVAYLDDDDWFAPEHLRTLREAVANRAWAHSMRWFVNPYNLEPMCVDTLENTGPNSGFYEAQGGFACPSTLMLDKLKCHFILPLWAFAGTPRGDGEDRVVFAHLRETFPDCGQTGEATALCLVKPEDAAHAMRRDLAIKAGYDVSKLDHGRSHGYERV